MNIIVCIKQVPDTTEVKINPETNTLMREGVKSIINPFDENAIEEALRLREKHGGKVTVLTMGPPQAEEALRQALAMGADDVILLSDRAFAGSDTWATSFALACAVRRIREYDVILCGKQAFDGDTAQVGPGLAEQLGIPQVTYAIAVEVNGRKARVKRLLEDGFEVVESRLPVLITVVKQINEPRYPSIKGMLKAKKTEIPTWTAVDVQAPAEKIGLAGSPTKVVRIFTPRHEREGEKLTGEVPDMVDQLVARLREQRVL